MADGPTGLGTVQRTTLGEQISQRLMDWMAQNRLQPGDRLPAENQLAQTFGVSRPVVREALRALAALDIVEISTGRPAQVKAFSPALISTFLHWGMSMGAITSVEIHEFRRGIEGESAALAAESADETARSELREIVAGMRADSADVAALGEWDVRLHLAIARVSGNVLLHHVMESMRQPVTDLVERGLERMQCNPQNVAQLLDEHDAIVQAICDRDPQRARATAVLVTERAITAFRKADSGG